MTQVRHAKTDTVKELDCHFGEEAKKMIRVAMIKADTDYQGLAALLTAAGRPITTQGLRNKVSGGKYSAAWFMHVLALLNYKMGQ
ncbi:DUF6471 domain-containing protein [Photobacterium ganghwense]|uniref:DUF6471 domain-containing protein n=1 Tax=Photobacterium ganghwense TaxID=320778 RepID=UPI001A8D6B33|nr:DUF6471 domain-containing protein [Photobacterium ganghwense]QSV17557.1 hypothetical protein FH974_25985 [Photobacterium ganghwense]